MMPARTLVTALLGWLLLAGVAVAADAPRTLTDVVISGDERTADVRLQLDGNQGRPLGRVYYSGDTIRIVVENTGFSGKGITRYDSDDSLVKRVEVHPQARNLSLLIHLNKRVGSIMERIVFTPGPMDSLITFRKEGFYEQPQAQAQALPTLPAAPLPVVEPPPLVAPLELMDAPPPPAADPNLPDELLARREQTLSSLLDSPLEEEVAPDEAVAVASPTQTVSERIEGVGVNTPDLTNLYIMTGVVLLVAALWFGLMRGRRVSLSSREEALKVVKTHSIGTRQRLMVVEAEGRRLLLSATDKDVRLLTDLGAGQAADEALSDAINSEKVRYLFNDNPQTQNTAARPTARVRTERPAYFGNSGSGRAFGGAASSSPAEEDGLREKLRGLRRKG